MEYAVVEIGGSQFRVKKGDIVRADFALARSKKTVKIDKVLLCHTGKKVELGSPYVKGASVSGDVISVGKADKVVAYKYKRRNDSRFKKGHRQRQVTLKIKELKID